MKGIVSSRSVMVSTVGITTLVADVPDMVISQGCLGTRQAD